MHLKQIETDMNTLDETIKQPEFKAIRDLPEEELNLIRKESQAMRKILLLISLKIQERFQTLLAAFRYFD